MEKKTVYVFSAGAALGALQVGMLKRFSETGVAADAVYGTSVGAINATGYAYGDVAGLESFWKKLDGFSDVFSFNWSSILFVSRGFFNSKPVRKLLENAIKGKIPRCPVTCCKVELSTGKLLYGTSDDKNFLDSVQASAAIPTLISPVKGCVDGGFREMTPLNKAIKEGATDIYCFLCRPWGDTIFGDTRWSSGSSFGQSFRIGYRAIEITLQNNVIHDIEKCIYYNLHPDPQHPDKINLFLFAPSKNFDPLDFSKENISEMINHGYKVEVVRPTLSDTKS